MKIEADLHNFGQSVQRIERGSGVYFRKPRPIYWERLFFGKDSALIPFFSIRKRQSWVPAEFLFNLETEIAADLTGHSLEVKTTSRSSVADSHLYSLGVLLAYCYVLGIRDLHKNNIVKTDTHLQVIDAEVVLSKLLLPHETLLLPFKEVGPEFCGATHAAWTELTSVDVKMVFDGFLDTFDCFFASQFALFDVFLAKLPELRTVPVRHILRDTFHYRGRHVRQPEIPFFVAEQRQLNRGDIPYFFKFIGSDEVFEITSPDGTFERVELPELFVKGAAREASMPADLLSLARLSELMPRGILFLAKKLLPRSWNGKIEGSDFAVELAESSISVTLPQGTYSSRR